VKLFVDTLGADTNAENCNKCSSLHMAVCRGYLEMVKLLVTELGHKRAKWVHGDAKVARELI
jgi:hypothetical protein